jgi:hypothetical protein
MFGKKPPKQSELDLDIAAHREGVELADPAYSSTMLKKIDDEMTQHIQAVNSVVDSASFNGVPRAFAGTDIVPMG